MAQARSIPEIFDQFKKATNEAERIAVLHNNITIPFHMVLALAMCPLIEIIPKKVPDYTPTVETESMGYNQLPGVLKRFYLFLRGHPGRPPNLSDERMNIILIQCFESLDGRDAEVLAGIIRRDLGIPHLTVKLINKALPGLFTPAGLDKLHF